MIVFGSISFMLGIYALFKMLTRREHFLNMVNGDILAFISLIAWVLTFMGGAAYFVFSGLDSVATRNFKIYIHTFPETYFIEGVLCLLLTYGFSKVKPSEQMQLSEGKKIFVIVGGILLGLFCIFLSLKKTFGD